MVMYFFFQFVSCDFKCTHNIKNLYVVFCDAVAHMNHRNEESGGGDHSRMNGHMELKRSCRVKKSQFEHLNQSLLFDQLVNR